MIAITEAERRYDAERNGTLYLPVPEPAPLSDQFAAVFRDKTLSMDEIGRRCAEIAIAATPRRVELPPYEPFGVLSDGSEVDGHTDDGDPTGRCGVVSTEPAAFTGYHLTAQDEPNTIDIQGDGFLIENATLAQLHTLRDLLNTTLPEQLLASAVAYGRGDVEPPMAAVPVPTVRTVCWYHDPDEGGDLTKEPCGPLGWTDYICGEGSTEVEISIGEQHKDVGRLVIAQRGEDVDFAALDLVARNITTILNDPRVQAARCGAALPAAPVVSMEHNATMPEPCTDFQCGDVILEIPDDRTKSMYVYNLGTDCSPLADAEQSVRNLAAILADPRVQALRQKAA